MKHSLLWENKPELKRVNIHMEAMLDPDEPANREQVIAWFDANVVPFYNAFRGRMDRLYVPASVNSLTDETDNE